jgi:hypothetical protein
MDYAMGGSGHEFALKAYFWGFKAQGHTDKMPQNHSKNNNVCANTNILI